MGNGGADSGKGSKHAGNMDDLMNIRMLKEVRKRQRGDKERQLKRDLDADDDDNASSEDPDDRRGNTVDVWFNMSRRLHASGRQKPSKAMKAYSRFVKTELCLRDGDPWLWMQIWDRMPFRACRLMDRTAFLKLTTLELFASVKTEDDLDAVRAAPIQAVRAEHQMAVVAGSGKRPQQPSRGGRAEDKGDEVDPDMEDGGKGRDKHRGRPA